MPLTPADLMKSPATCASLAALQLIEVTGPDAESFLHGQLTNRVIGLGADEAALYGYCSPKGRLLVSAIGFRHRAGIALIVPSDMADTTARRLKMFVLRAKCQVELSTEPIYGVTVAGDLEEALPPLWRTQVNGERRYIGIPAMAGTRRALVIGFAAASQDPPAAFAHTPLAVCPESDWALADLKAGLPWINKAASDRFVPQMANFDALGGIDFKKGCFPGQEVVARSQYLGKLKRRMALVEAVIPEELAIGTAADVYADGSSEPVGSVINACRQETSWTGLAEVALTAWDAPLHLDSANGPVIHHRALPYVVPDNEVFVRPKL